MFQIESLSSRRYLFFEQLPDILVAKAVFVLEKLQAILAFFITEIRERSVFYEEAASAVHPAL